MTDVPKPIENWNSRKTTTINASINVIKTLNGGSLTAIDEGQQVDLIESSLSPKANCVEGPTVQAKKNWATQTNRVPRPTGVLSSDCKNKSGRKFWVRKIRAIDFGDYEGNLELAKGKQSGDDVKDVGESDKKKRNMVFGLEESVEVKQISKREDGQKTSCERNNEDESAGKNEGMVSGEHIGSQTPLLGT
ncbi:hypothetical protein QYF36_022348 [Acer negundo]|nr:hypothetical protein QYF36_022348 [Acer negundo]